MGSNVIQHTFRKLAETARRIGETRGSNAKISICADFFRSIGSDDDLRRAAQFLGEGAFSSVSEKRASVGSRTYSTCAAAFCEIDYDKVFKPCKTALGSASEAIEKLMGNLATAREKREPADLTLREVEQIYEALHRASTRVKKQEILRSAWKKMTPVEIKYFIRILTQGSLRIGFETRSITTAIAEAFNHPVDKVRYTHMITGSIGKTAVLGKNDNLDKANFELFHPVSFMLASPIQSRTIDQIDAYIAEEKFDGMRSQVHVGSRQIKLFSRDLNEITPSFPDVARFFLDKDLPDLVLDGEICVFKEEKIMPFQLLQKRMGRKKPSKKILNEFPVIFISYDILYHRKQPMFDQPLAERRETLEALSNRYDLPITNQYEVDHRGHVDKLFERALAHGNEGLMLKKTDSHYEYGQRKKSWLKVKKPGGTLDTVIMYAHPGSGKRGGYYSDFTLGIRVDEDERYEEEFIPIGKAYGGYTDDEMKRLNREIKNLVVDRYGPTLALKPGIVVEIEFDDIQVNKRTKANYTLRLPRFKAIRWDLGPSDTDTLEDVERLYQEKLNRDRLRQGENPSFYINSES